MHNTREGVRDCEDEKSKEKGKIGEKENELSS